MTITIRPATGGDVCGVAAVGVAIPAEGAAVPPAPCVCGVPWVAGGGVLSLVAGGVLSSSPALAASGSITATASTPIHFQ